MATHLDRARASAAAAPTRWTGHETGLVARLAQAARDNGLLLAHWKSNHRLAAAAAGEDDLDLSIPPDQDAALGEFLRQLGFVAFRGRPWQRHVGISDWLGLEPQTGALLHIHLHSRLVTGADGVMEQTLPWLDAMNEALETDQVTGLDRPPPAFDAHLLLVREAVKSVNLRNRFAAMLGGDPISSETRREMDWLLGRCSTENLDSWGRRLWDPDVWGRLSPHFRDAVRWDKAALGCASREIRRALRDHRRMGPLRRDLTYLGMRLLRFLHRLRALASGTTVSGKRLVGARAPIIAIIGSDGAGKSTVSADLRRWLAAKADVATVYFGTNHGWFRRLREVVMRLRPGGKPKEEGAKASARIDARPARFPLWLQAVKWAVMARLRLRTQRRALRLTAAGTVILADRYPQTQVRGTYDGPSHLDLPGLGPLGRALQKIEHRCFAKMAEIEPDLVIKLIAPVEVAMARKSDHDPESLAQRVAITRALRFDRAPVVEIDAAQPLEDVTNVARRHVWLAVRAAKEGRGALH